MRMVDDPAQLAALILNSCWFIRHHFRGARSSIGRAQRQAAIEQLGVIVRDALTCSDPSCYESIFAAIVDGLRPRDEPPF